MRPVSGSEQASAPSIQVSKDGPYLVSGGIPLKRRRHVVSEHDEPLTWQTVTKLPTGSGYALCRCGGSANKPFCDGTHTRRPFDGTEAAPASTYDERQKTYLGTGIVVRDDRSICEHAGFCSNRVSNVWDMVKSGATEDSLARAQVMAMIERCPSGALSYRLEADGQDVEPELPVEIGVVEDGPLWVTGRVAIERSDDQTFEPRNRVTLCRCGQSSNKPLCDGSHKKAGFRDSG